MSWDESWTLYLTQQKVNDVEHHAEWKLGSKESEEPLGCIHMSFQVQITEVAVQVWQLFLKAKSKG
ncbi:mCG1051112 [Mus musculus]|nr:mCG1051112 [Mus musculus]